MGLFVAPLSSVFSRARNTVSSLQHAFADDEVFGLGWAPFVAAPTLPEVVPYVFLAAGVATTFFPHLRGRYLEGRYGLQEGGAIPRSLLEVLDLVTATAPTVRVTHNVLRTDQLAFVYPAGFRRPCLAIFGGLLILWRSDRQAAEAVLLHEISHFRRGDHLLIGTGSFLEWMLRRWWLFTFLLLIVPALILWTEMALTFTASSPSLGAAVVEASHQFWTEIAPSLGGAHLVTLLLWPPAVFLVPVLCIWAAELAADRTAAGAGLDALIRALPKHEGRRAFSIWLLQRISHPPMALRRWLLGRGETFAHVILLGLFPAAYVVRFAFLTVWSIATYLTLGSDFELIAGSLPQWWRSYAGAMAWPFLTSAIISAAWPVLGPLWQRLITGTTPLRTLPSKEFWLTGTFLCAATLLMIPSYATGVPEGGDATPVIALDRPHYQRGEEIPIRYSNTPGNAQDWLSLVPAGAPEDEWGTWTYTEGQTAGIWTVQGVPPGRYEVRLYFDWPAGGYTIQARWPLEVRE